MATRPTTTVRIDPILRSESSLIFKQLGVTTSSAVNIFLKAVVSNGGFPFDHHVIAGAPKNKSKNLALNNACSSRKDEFYTDYRDVEAELSHYPDQFRGRKVLCNCDDPLESAFVRFFVRNFNRLGLEQLIATSYIGTSISRNSEQVGLAKSAKFARVTNVPDALLQGPDGKVDWGSLFSLPGNKLASLNGDGDFRSPECAQFLRDSDVVVTNPPFSLFRDFVGQIMKYEKDFLILGNMNATTYKEVFPLFKENVISYGPSIRSGDRKFQVPDDYPLDASGCGIDNEGKRFIRIKGVRWFTNLKSETQSTSLVLQAKFTPDSYPKYDNYDAINVDRVIDIPSDFDGIMGVPITFLDKFDPAQFEILMLANGNARTNTAVDVLRQVGYIPSDGDKGGVGLISGRRVYARILVKKRRT